MKTDIQKTGYTKVWSEMTKSETADSIRKKIPSSDPELCKSLEIRAISSRDGVLLTALHAKNVFSRGTRANLVHEGCVHQYRSMNANESVGLELLRYIGDRFAQQIRAAFTAQQNIISFRLHRHDIAKIDEKNSSVAFDSDLRVLVRLLGLKLRHQFN